MSFPDPGPMPPPVLQLTDVSFGYPGSKQLYKNLNFGLDLDSRITLVGPNGQGEGGGGCGVHAWECRGEGIADRCLIPPSSPALLLRLQARRRF